MPKLYVSTVHTHMINWRNCPGRRSRGGAAIRRNTFSGFPCRSLTAENTGKQPAKTVGIWVLWFY